MLIDLYIGILLWLLVNGICMIVGYFIGRGSVWAEINRNEGITKEDGEEDQIYGEVIDCGKEIIIKNHDGSKMMKINEYGLSFFDPEKNCWTVVEGKIKDEFPN